MAAALAALALLGAAALGPAQEKGDGWVRLFNGKDFTGWRKFVDPRSKADPDKVWTVQDGQDGIIVCAGRPNGYLITEKEYGDFVLRVQWRWGKTAPARGRNSGVFVWVSGPDKIWPKGVEAQLYSGSAGDIWLVDGFKLQVDPARQDPKQKRHFFRIDKGKMIEKPIGEWNQYEITCKGDTVKLVVNGQPENEGTMAERTKGKILLQSEGAEIHFRNIAIKTMK
jgi:hypothetical protein